MWDIEKRVNISSKRKEEKHNPYKQRKRRNLTISFYDESYATYPPK